MPWPKKTRELFHNHFDSTYWNDFKFRDDDIIVASYAKSGTTWIQQILSQLIFKGAEGINVSDISPWLDSRSQTQDSKLQLLEAQTHRRMIKTHLPVDALVYSPESKYIYIARDGRDVVWSYYNHHSRHTPDAFTSLNESLSPGIEPFLPVDLDVREYFLRWLDRDGYPIWSFWDNVASWWEIRELPNLMVLHFNSLKLDLPGKIHQIAEFLEIPIAETDREKIIEHCTFEYMKEHAEHSAPLSGALWEGGASTFINRGVNGRWRDILTADDCNRYERLALEKLGPECAIWLQSGKLQQQTPNGRAGSPSAPFTGLSG